MPVIHTLSPVELWTQSAPPQLLQKLLCRWASCVVHPLPLASQGWLCMVVPLDFDLLIPCHDQLHWMLFGDADYKYWVVIHQRYELFTVRQ